MTMSIGENGEHEPFEIAVENAKWLRVSAGSAKFNAVF
jgi:hypothetical protein